MIPYHGGPITPIAVAAKLWTGRHALVSFYRPDQIEVAAEVCQDFILDNGAFSAWKKGVTIDWAAYYKFVNNWQKHPACSWALMPDSIEGSEADNDTLISEWPHGSFGVPVWHMHESLGRLKRLCEEWPRVAIGSSGQWKSPGSNLWWTRMAKAMDTVCLDNGQPMTSLHGLRMMNPRIFSKIPFASVDSSTIARNIGIDRWWNGQWSPKSKQIRALVLADRYEATPTPAYWKGHKI